MLYSQAEFLDKLTPAAQPKQKERRRKSPALFNRPQARGLEERVKG